MHEKERHRIILSAVQDRPVVTVAEMLEAREVLEVPDDAFEHTPSTLQGPAKQLVQGVYKLDGSLLLLLDVQHTMQFDPNVEAIEH